MELRTAIIQAISQFGKQIVTEARFVSVLCDFHGFDSAVPAKNIIGNALRLGYMDKLYQNYSNSLKVESISQDFAKRNGFEQSLVTTVFNQIAEVLISSKDTDTTCYYKRMQVPVVFIIDSSDCMCGSKVGSVNDLMENLIALLSLNDERDPYAQGYIACVAYGDKAYWLDNVSYRTSEYIWKGINGKGKSNVSNAFSLLKKDFKILFEQKHYDPILILISASKSSDNYESIIQELSKYYEYEYAIRVGIAIGDDADYKLLKDFASSEDTVVSVHNIETLNNLVSYRYSYPELPASNEPIKSFFF
jgi:uncharacterized protein YegL